MRKILFDNRFLNREAGGITTDSKNILDYLSQILQSPAIIQTNRNSIFRFGRRYVFWQQQMTLPPVVLGKKVFVRVHDLFPITNPKWFSKKAVFSFKLALLYYKKINSTFICNSYYTEKVLKRYFPEADSLVLWCEPRSRSEVPCGVCDGCDFLKVSNLSGKFLVAVGTIEPRKNYSAMLKLNLLINSLDLKYKVIIIGRYGWKQEHIYLKLRSEVILIENACDNFIVEIQKLDSIYLSTSFDEGFGLPALEWRLINKPIILPRLEIYLEIHKDTPGVFFYSSIEDIPVLLKEIEKESTILNSATLPNFDYFDQLNIQKTLLSLEISENV